MKNKIWNWVPAFITFGPGFLTSRIATIGKYPLDTVMYYLGLIMTIAGLGLMYRKIIQQQKDIETLMTLNTNSTGTR